MTTKHDLRGSTAHVPRWGGEFVWWQTIRELRAFGLSWREIEADAMTRRVTWEK